jgi:uncharacterized protein YjbI with pentapeptide repeats
VKKRTGQTIWMVCGIQAIVVLGGVGLLGIRLYPYWQAKYRGYLADPRRAILPGAPLAGADLYGANLQNANLRNASLGEANLEEAKLAGADLTNANLSFARLSKADLTGTDLTGAKLATVLMDVDLRSVRNLTRANLHNAVDYGGNRWPKGFDPKQHGVISVRLW